jgi:Protein of unknown function (DUF1569)
MRTLAHARDKAEIIGRWRTLRPESERRWGRMSAHQMVCHVADSFRMALGTKAVSPASGRLQRTIVKWVALYAPVPWPAGRILTSPEIDQEAEGCTRPGDFAADLSETETLLERLTSPRSVEPQPHPVFGPLSHRDWLRWGYLHTDHHLRQFSA